MDKAAAIRAVEQEQLRLREAAFEDAARRRRALFERHHELEALYNAAESVYAQWLMRGLSEPGAQTDVLAEAEREHARRASLLEDALKSAGASLADVQPRFACPLCEDRGYLTEPVYARCACFNNKLARLMAPLSTQSGHSFETFDINVFPETQLPGGYTQREAARQARAWCEAYADEFPGHKRLNVLLTGKAGLGKTFLLECIAGRVAARGIHVMSVSAFHMQSAMRAYHMSKDTAAFEEMLAVPLLTIDDLGTEPMMENITIEYLYILVSERAANRRGLVVTTNLEPKELKQRYTERILSRLYNPNTTLTCGLQGEDIRRIRH